MPWEESVLRRKWSVLSHAVETSNKRRTFGFDRTKICHLLPDREQLDGVKG